MTARWKGFNLLNMFYKGGKKSDSPFAEEDFRMMSEWGFNFVRIPADYRIVIKSNDWNIMDENAMRRIDDAVELGGRYNIHICLNLHRAPGYTVANPPEAADLWTQKEPQEAFCRMWAYFAERYKDVPVERLSFNFVNEPASVDEAPYAAVIRMAANAIREKDSKRLLIADGLNFGRIPVYMIKDLDIVQGARGYEPFNLTHYKAEWVEDSMNFPVPEWPDKNSGDSGNDSGKWLWDGHFKQWDKFKKDGGQYFVGEWGAHNKTPHKVVLKWMEDNLRNFKNAGTGWALWNLHGSFGILNSGRADVEYEDFNGYKLDRQMLNLLLKYL